MEVVGPVVMAVGFLMSSFGFCLLLHRLSTHWDGEVHVGRLLDGLAEVIVLFQAVFFWYSE